MEEQFLIRPATPGDTGEILRLVRELAEYEKLSELAVGTEPMLREALFGAQSSSEALVAERGGRIVGFALFFSTFSTFLCKPGIYLEDLFVEPQHRGAGIGKALLQRLAAMVIERGGGRFEWRVLDWNDPSIRFYESLGATLMREWLLVRLAGEPLQRLAAGSSSAAPSQGRISRMLEAHNALEREQSPQRISAWMRVNSVIDPRDDIFHFFAKHELACNPVREYLSDGWRTLSELMVVMDSVDRPLARTGAMLEFAAGFGRFTRHLACLLPGRVTASDVHPGSVDFLREQFGVEGFYSTHDPERLDIPGQYDLVFVLSMFTHLPPPLWTLWLRKLFAAVRPGGYLVFTVHNEGLAAHYGVPYEADGTHFRADSESRELTPETYGTTLTTRAFVEQEVERALGRPVAQYRELAFWVGQDAVLVRGG